MVHTSKETEKAAALNAAEMMCAAARTAPKACGVDLTDTLVLTGEDKDRLTAAMREMGEETKRPFFIRDAGNVDTCHAVMLIGAGVAPRKLNCGLCGVPNCKAAEEEGVSCAMAVHDLGIAVGSAASVAMDHRMDNRVLFTAGMAALKLGLFPADIKTAFGIPLSVSGKNVFFDR